MLQQAVQKMPVRAAGVCECPALAKLGMVVRYRRGETIFAQGDEARYSYKVVSGAVRHSKFLQNGHRQIADFSLPGEYFGFADDGEHSLTSEALSDVVAVRYPRGRLEQLGEEASEVRNQMLSNLRRNLILAQEHLVMLGRQSAKARVASFIVALADRTEARNGDTIVLPMGRQDIADYLGLTIETVSRTITELKRSGILKVPSRHELVLLRLQMLEEMANGDCEEL